MIATNGHLAGRVSALAPFNLLTLQEMIELRVHETLETVRKITNLRVLIEVLQDRKTKDPFLSYEPASASAFRQTLSGLDQQCESIGLPTTRVTIKRILEIFERASKSDGSIRLETKDLDLCLAYAKELQGRIIDELTTQYVMVIPHRSADYLSKASTIFGDEVTEIFPVAIVDISEAAKCLALGRYTATAFHLMRAVEIGMRSLAERLGVELSHNANWQKILNDKLEPAINALPESDDVSRSRRRQMQQARAHLHAIRLAWRNDTMHPKATYTEEEATDLFNHVRTFLRHLAAIL